jgi:uridine phosphorylase
VPILLRPTAPVAREALLPGDPSRALAIAQALLEEPRMSNHGHGLWGYHGRTATGRELTIQATGVGGPSGAIVLADLAELGARAALRVGPCVSLAADLRAGELLICDRILAADGTSAALGAGGWVEPDPGLLEALVAAAGPAARAAPVASADLLWDPTDAERRLPTRRAAAWRADGAVAVDMQTAALVTLGARLGVPVACLLVVSDLGAGPSGDDVEESLTEASKRAGEIGALALRSAAQVSGSERVARS